MPGTISEENSAKWPHMSETVKKDQYVNLFWQITYSIIKKLNEKYFICTQEENEVTYKKSSCPEFSLL